MNATPTSEILYGAAAHIAQYGHHKGSGFADGERPSKSPACSIGAICVAATALGAPTTLAIDAMTRHVDAGPHSLVGWSDDPERTQAEVVEAFTAAAVIEAAREEQDAAWETYAEQVTA